MLAKSAVLIKTRNNPKRLETSQNEQGKLK